MLSKGIMQETKRDIKMDVKQFKTATGSPITYTRFRKHKGIYYPLAKTHLNSQKTCGPLPKHMCVVFSKMYGREMYGNIDIWPNDDVKARMKAEKEYYNMFHHSEADIPLLETDAEICVTGETPHVQDYTKSADDIAQSRTENNNHVKKHVTIKVTDTSDDDAISSEGEEVHPPIYDEQGPVGEDGTWPIKRSQSVDSRDNPFMPGGSLSQEADDILSRATIIRDTFILKDNNGARSEAVARDANASEDTPVVEEQVTAKVAGDVEASRTANTAAAPKGDSNDVKPKENGQLDTDTPVTPVNEKVDPDKNKKKQQKCCTVM